MLSRIDRAGVRIAVVSSNTEWVVREVLGPGPAECVRHYACGAAMFGKAVKFKQVLKKAGVPAAEAISIGDETRDVEAARKVGVTPAVVTWGYATPEALAGLDPLHIFETPGDIASLVAPKTLGIRRRARAGA
jgi:phosphoglycolate phosphatase